MLMKSYLALGLAVSLGFSAAAMSGLRMFPAVSPAAVGGPGSRGVSGVGVGGGHHTGGYHSTWHGGK